MDETQNAELTLEHARTGYANAQETVRFVDTKSGVMTGIVTITTGLPLVLMQWLLSADNSLSGPISQAIPTSQRCIVLAGVAIAFGLLGIFFGSLSLISSTGGLMARMPKSQTTKAPSALTDMFSFLLEMVHLKKRPIPRHRVTALFPLFPPDRLTDAQKVFKRVRLGSYSLQDVLDEYAVQLESIGYILNTKIRYNGYAVRWFEFQVLSYFVSAVLATACALCLVFQNP